VVFTSFPVLFAAIFNKDVSAKGTMARPELYVRGPKNELFSLWKLFLNIMEGLAHSIILYYFSQNLYSKSSAADGRVDDQWVASTFMYSSLVFVVTFRLCLQTWTFTIISKLFLFLSWLVWFGFCYLYEWLNLTPDFYGIPNRLFGFWLHWFGMVVVILVCLAPKVVFLYVKRTYFPGRRDVIQEIDRGYGADLLKAEGDERSSISEDATKTF
jgi:phospholipid-transporting ATPase